MKTDKAERIRTVVWAGLSHYLPFLSAFLEDKDLFTKYRLKNRYLNINKTITFDLSRVRPNAPEKMGVDIVGVA